MSRFATERFDFPVDSLGSCRSLLLNYAGGDGIDFGDGMRIINFGIIAVIKCSTDPGLFHSCAGPPAMTNVHVKDVVLDNHLRQGTSMTTAALLECLY